jgi:hypothetical protein
VFLTAGVYVMRPSRFEVGTREAVMATQTRARSGVGTARDGHDTGQANPTADADVTDETVSDEAPPDTARTGVSTGNHPRAAADQATRHNSTQVHLPMLGTVRLPATEELAFLGGVGVLAVVGAIEWPVAVVLAAGHTLATNRRNKVVQEFGEALEKA